jgi:hypothetical protein
MKIAMHVPFPAPELGDAQPCSVCEGAGITGERYTMQVGERGLAVDVFCPACGGCGRAAHEGCREDEHGIGVDDEPDDVFGHLDQDDSEEGQEDGEPACWSCHGRTWFPVQGFTEPGENSVVLVLKMPCGCVENRAVPIEPTSR